MFSFICITSQNHAFPVIWISGHRYLSFLCKILDKLSDALIDFDDKTWELLMSEGGREVCAACYNLVWRGVGGEQHTHDDKTDAHQLNGFVNNLPHKQPALLFGKISFQICSFSRHVLDLSRDVSSWIQQGRNRHK